MLSSIEDGDSHFAVLSRFIVLYKSFTTSLK